jgi:hypothetical protein
MYKHTTGQWRVTTSEIAVINEAGKTIASLDSEGSPDIEIEESLANANLMAAAPEMLALLKESFFKLKDSELAQKIESLIRKIESEPFQPYGWDEEEATQAKFARS